MERIEKKLENCKKKWKELKRIGKMERNVKNCKEQVHLILFLIKVMKTIIILFNS